MGSACDYAAGLGSPASVDVLISISAREEKSNWSTLQMTRIKTEDRFKSLLREPREAFFVFFFLFQQHIE